MKRKKVKENKGKEKRIRKEQNKRREQGSREEHHTCPVLPFRLLLSLFLSCIFPFPSSFFFSPLQLFNFCDSSSFLLLLLFSPFIPGSTSAFFRLPVSNSLLFCFSSSQTLRIFFAVLMRYHNFRFFGFVQQQSCNANTHTLRPKGSIFVGYTPMEMEVSLVSVDRLLSRLHVIGRNDLTLGTTADTSNLSFH